MTDVHNGNVWTEGYSAAYVQKGHTHRPLYLGEDDGQEFEGLKSGVRS